MRLVWVETGGAGVVAEEQQGRESARQNRISNFKF